MSLGHLDNHLQICVEEGLDPITAIQMASLNATECFGLRDRGAIAPGLRADIVLLDNLQDFSVKRVFIQGEKVAREGKYLPEVHFCDNSAVRGSFHGKEFSLEKLKLKLSSNRVHIIDILPGGVVTGKAIAEIKVSDEGDFVYQPEQDIVRVCRPACRSFNRQSSGIGRGSLHVLIVCARFLDRS